MTTVASPALFIWHLRISIVYKLKSSKGQLNHGLTGETPCRHYYLVSDYQRLHPDSKGVSWRYDWFEKWFLDYVTDLDWQAITREAQLIAAVGLEKELAKMQTKLDDIQRSLARLLKFVKIPMIRPKPSPTKYRGWKRRKSWKTEKRSPWPKNWMCWPCAGLR